MTVPLAVLSTWPSADGKMTREIDHGALKHRALERDERPTAGYRPDLNKPRKGNTKMTRQAYRSIKQCFPAIALVMACSGVVIRAADEATPAAAAPAEAATVAPPSGSLVERIAAIRGHTQAEMVAVRGHHGKVEAVRQKGREELAALMAEFEAGDRTKLSPAGHVAMAGVYSRELGRFDDAARHAQIVVDAEPTNAEAWEMLVWAQAWNPNTLAAAEQNLAKAVQLLPRDKHAGLHNRIAGGLMRAGQHRAAADHLAAVLDLARDKLLAEAAAPKSYLQHVEQTVAVYCRVKADDVALARLDRELAALASDEAHKARIDSPLAVAELTAQKIRLLLRSGQAEQGRALLDEALRNARSAYDAAPEDAARLQALLPLARLEWELSSAANKPDAPDYTAKRAQFLQLLGELVRHDKVASGVRRVCAELALAAGWELLADGRLADAESVAVLLAEAVMPDANGNSELRRPIDPFENSVRIFVRRVTTEPGRLALIGQPAFPLEIDAWASGSPLTDDDLQGKVVLLHFWAVWSDESIGCFPHLRDWHEKHADRGLVIIGLTRYYGQAWDATAGQPIRVENLSRQEEQAALVQFAEHHMLKHRLAFLPANSTLWERYLVSGFPDQQMVLIDREGKVRMIRLARDDRNSQAIEALIEELLAAPVESAPAGEAPAAETPASDTP